MAFMFNKLHHSECQLFPLVAEVCVLKLLFSKLKPFILLSILQLTRPGLVK